MYFFLRPVRPGGIIEVPQISRIYTDFFFHYTLSADETYSVGLRRFSRLHCSPLRKRFVLKSSFNSLYDPFGSPCRGQKPSLPLKKAPPLISVFSPQGRRGKPPYSVLEPLRYKVGGPSEVSPDFAGWDRQGWNGDRRGDCLSPSGRLYGNRRKKDYYIYQPIIGL